MSTANNKPFKLDGWLQTSSYTPSYSQENNLEECLAKLTSITQDKENLFHPSYFLTPGWKGDGLFSKEALSIKKALMVLWKDSKSQFFEFERLNKSLRLIIFNEFTLFNPSSLEEVGPLSEYKSFWHHLETNSKKHQKVLKEFIDIYTFRMVVTYIYKVRFILKLCDNFGSEVYDKYLRNPSTFLSRIFKKGSSTELRCEALQMNHYSWYRPSRQVEDDIHKLCANLRHLSITELMKVCTYQQDYAVRNFQETKQKFSHSLSHKAFGVFLNNLIVNLPKWISSEGKFSRSETFREDLKVLNTKYVGNYLTSISQSHWLAQYNNLFLNWDSVICPDFADSTFNNGNFVRQCHEINFVSFLIDIAQKLKIDPISFISKIMKEKYNNSIDRAFGQMTMFDSDEMGSNLLYDRIVISLCDLPKKNPHHYMLTTISNEIESLNKEGQIIVLTNQKLFVPSQSHKVSQLLEKVSVSSIVELESIEGKGEIPSYIYVLNKRVKNISNFTSTSSETNSEKEPCLTFRLSGELKQFQFFQNFSEFLIKFFTEKNTSTSLYQKEISKDLSIEFFQDAVLEGKRLHSENQDPNRITHPSFFKNVTKSSYTFDSFFQIENIQTDFSKFHSNQSGNFYSSLISKKNFPYLLIVNYSDPKKIALEIAQFDTLKAKLEKYGNAFYRYFGLIPKISNLNINIFRDYFKTDLGSQIIQLSLNGRTTKLKGKVRSMLIPKFFMEFNYMPEHYEEDFKILSASYKELIKKHPENLKNSFNKILPTIHNLGRKYPWHTLSLICYFKNECAKSLEKVTSINGRSHIFTNPVVVEKLIQLQTYSLYPSNKEVFIDFEFSDKEFFKSPLQKTKIEKIHNQECLALISNNQTILRLYSEPVVLKFIEFICQSALNYPISDIISGLRIPKFEDINHALAQHEFLHETLSRVKSEIEKNISEIIMSQINN